MSAHKPTTPTEILRAAVARAKEIPLGLNMGTWIEQSEDTPCGTVGCLAYEICAVAGDLTNAGTIQEQAAGLIGLDDSSPALFFLDYWPERFRQQYQNAGSPEGRAAALEAVVESWIAGTWYESDNLVAGGNVYLEGYTHPLPESLTSIGGYVDLRGYTHPLPESLTSIGGYVDLEGYTHPLPESLTSIGGYVYLEGYTHPLPESLTSIGGYVYLEGYTHPLPESLTSIGGYVDLEGYTHKDKLPAPTYGNKK